MRIFVVVVLLASYVAAKGSGPYLPTGWRPQGPAFYLPSEVEKPKENPVKDIIYQGSEASGSDSFQEYGPPKDGTVFLELSNQGLPDIVTEQTFAVVEAKVNENKEQEVVTEVKEVIQDSEANLSQQSIVQEIVPVTELLALVETATTVAETEELVESVDIQPDVETTTQLSEEVTSAVVETEEIVNQSVSDVVASQQTSENEQQNNIVEIVQQENENANSNIVSTFEERVQVENVQTVEKEVQRVQTEVKRIESEVQKIETQVQNFEAEVKTEEHVAQNIPELLNSIDNEIKQQQVENVQEVTDAKVNLETFGSLEKAPEGFLEYGPPGFKEYGPPKELERTTDEVILPEAQPIENNEARKRRFSPKFRTARKVNKH